MNGFTVLAQWWMSSTSVQRRVLQLLLLPGPLAQQTFFITHTGLLTATFQLIWEEVETLMSFVFFQMASYDFFYYLFIQLQQILAVAQEI